MVQNISLNTIGNPKRFYNNTFGNALLLLLLCEDCKAYKKQSYM